MNEITKKFIELAHKAMLEAYYNESKGMTDLDSETVKKVGNALEVVGGLRWNS